MLNLGKISVNFKKIIIIGLKNINIKNKKYRFITHMNHLIVIKIKVIKIVQNYLYKVKQNQNYILLNKIQYFANVFIVFYNY